MWTILFLGLVLIVVAIQWLIIFNMAASATRAESRIVSLQCAADILSTECTIHNVYSKKVMQARELLQAEGDYARD